VRCPVCKADVGPGPQCRRCRADLALLFELERHRARLLETARGRLARGQWQEAARLADDADALQRGDESRRLRVAARLLGGDFAGAWDCYHAARRDVYPGEPGTSVPGGGAGVSSGG
jgi:hypothetical protein